MMTPNRQRPTLPSVVIPATPPLMYASHFSTPPCSTTSSASSSSSSYFSPASPTIVTPRQEREIMMGGLVSRSPSPRDSGEYDEKCRQGSIEVPGIVLTEPLPDSPPRCPSPPAKHILLLPPTTLPIPTESSMSSSRPLSPAFLTLIHGSDRRKPCSALTTARSVLLLGALALGAWHLWSTLDIATLVEDVADNL